MKAIKIVLLLSFVTLVSCDLGSGNLSYSNVKLYVSEKTIPSTGIINQALPITAKAAAPNDGWYNLQITLEENPDHNYSIYATGNYDSRLQEGNTVIYSDTTLTITPTVAGNYIITTWVTPLDYERDTIVVTAEEENPITYLPEIIR